MVKEGCILRLLVLGVKAQKPRRYYLSFHALASGSTPAAAGNHAVDSNSRTDEQQTLGACRTETASISNSPEFTNRVVLLRLPTAVPDATSSSSTDAAGSRVAVALLAAPTLDDPAPQSLPGKEVKHLVAAGFVDLLGDVAARLSQGDRVTLPVQLQEVAVRKVQMASGLGGEAAQLQGQRSSMAATTNSSIPGVYQVLLELMLLDPQQLIQRIGSPAVAAGKSVPAAAAVQQAAASQQQQQSFQQAAASGQSDPVSVAEPEVVLSVVVSAAVNLPMVPGSDSNQLVPPSAFVALKSAADAAAKRPAQATTAVAQQTQNPVWSQLLTVTYPEAGLPQEQLLLSVVHSVNNRVLVKGALLLSGMVTGQYYSLAVSLSETCVLYVTLHLGSGAHSQLEALQGSGMPQAATAPGQLKLLQARLPTSNPPVQALASKLLSQQQQQQKQQGRSEIWALFRSSPSQISSSSTALQPLHAAVDGREGNEKSIGGVLRSINGRSGLLSTSSVGAAADNNHIIAALPVQSVADDVNLWPQDHLVLLPIWLSNPAAAVLDLLLVTYPNSSTSSTSSSNISKSFFGKKQPPPPPQQQQQLQPRAVVFARLQVLSSSLVSQQYGKLLLLRDQVLLDPTAAAADMTVAAKLGTASFEVIVWDVAAYFDRLKQLLAAAEAQRNPAAAAAAAAKGQLAQTFSANSNLDQRRGMQSQDSVLNQLGHPSVDHISATQNPRVVSDMLDMLVSDVMTKQQAIEQVQKALDAAENRREVAVCKVGELQEKVSHLTADLEHLRRLLHDEKEAAAHALDGTSIAALAAKNPSKDELFKQLSFVTAAQAKERARNAELVHRLQQLHAEQIDVLGLQKMYAELQEAHYQQSQEMVDQETNLGTIRTLKKAVQDQESVITRLEKLLAGAVSRSKELEGWKTTAEAWESEATRLRDELSRLAAARPADDLAQAASKTAAAMAEQQAAAVALNDQQNAAAQTKAEYDIKLAALEAEKLSAFMRIEKAEAAATAAHNELLDVTKKYAREVAQLKTRLAEKDAQLLGGFGSLASLQLGELGPVSTSLDPTGSMQTQNPGFAGPGSQGLGGMGDLGFSSAQMPGLGLMGQGVGDDLGLGMGSGRYMQNLMGAGGGVQGYSAAAAAGAGSSRTGSPRLEPLAGSQQQQQQGMAPGYQLRASTGEGPKPGSPLAPIPQQRFSTSAEGYRSGAGSLNAGMNHSGSLRRTGSPAGVAAAAAAGILAAAASPAHRTASPAAAGLGVNTPGGSPAAAAMIGTPSPVRAGMVGVASGSRTGSPMMQPPRSPLLSGAAGPVSDDQINEGRYQSGVGADDDYNKSQEPGDAYQQQQQQQQAMQQQRGAGAARPGQVSMRQQQQQQVADDAGRAGGASMRQQQQPPDAGGVGGGPAPGKSGLRKWFG